MSNFKVGGRKAAKIRLVGSKESVIIENEDGLMIGEIWDNGTLVLFKQDFDRLDSDKNTIALQLKGTD